MITKKIIQQVLRENLNWFIHSGVMNPSDGSWGVAERIASNKNNSAIEKMYATFPAWTEFDGYSIIEQRRADCNFETAWLFLLAAEALEEPKYRTIAESILDFLYFKSGLLNRFDENRPMGSWNWSHIEWKASIWFDDNAWNGIIQLMIGRKYSELNKKYKMTDWAYRVAESMLDAFVRTFECPNAESAVWSDPEEVWLGNLKLPHWGSLACMLFTMAYSEKSNEKYSSIINKYYKYVWKNRDSFIVSEDAYVLLGASWAADILKDPFYTDISIHFADKIISKMDPQSGNIPAEHYEAPVGTHLVDMIYTANWALLGMQIIASETRNQKYCNAFEELLNLTVKIQDQSKEKQYHGCWRGMYDMKNEEWGGGDCYEGGAGSIYSGWTNAPISWVLAYEMLGASLISNK